MNSAIRHDWQQSEVADLFNLPLNDLLFRAHTVHRQCFNPNEVQVSTLLSIKTGACPEDCKYCAQSGHYKTSLERERLVSLDKVKAEAQKAKAAGATRFCMGAGWRCPPEKQLDAVIDMVKEVKDMGMEACVTLGMLSKEQADKLKDAGLDYYNHNLDTSREYYPEIIKTRTFDDRLETIAHVRNAGINVCSGGIVGLGEGRHDRESLLIELANLPEQPKSVPINVLIPIKGTPLENREIIDSFEVVRTVAVARILMPKSVVRLTAGRHLMNDEMHSLVFFAGANSIHSGEKLLTVPSRHYEQDYALFDKLGINKKQLESA
ncbi:Biotin synthase [Piscirickettsia salmonis]|uniref:biotin synthase BioB n=1 Tax=Piscirickettsia salmonis TaxID=1238 RepID=UPI0012BA69AF|nr:biotin synthase BioB [Piscirickettsia salmonis]QGP56058.1 Biotin synthase [Piscirickettsia salmonis]QGP58071.1 Biotin synthase [Piscirickettsia salmonis]QGP65628.1 Biotin synthase [Piscirickettsia salmonis]